jgi:hypothetical protein
MPPIYRGKCSNCGYESPPTGNGLQGIILDQPIQTPHAHPENNRIVFLGHPLETSIMKDLGYTYSSAIREGRLLIIEHLFCTSCGNIYESRRLHGYVGRAKSLTLLFLPIAVGVFVGYVESSFVLGLVIWGLLAPLITWLLRRVRFVSPDARAKKLHPSWEQEFGVNRQCPHCGSCDSSFPGSVGRRLLPCPKCEQKKMKVECIGRS